MFRVLNLRRTRVSVALLACVICAGIASLSYDNVKVHPYLVHEAMRLFSFSELQLYSAAVRSGSNLEDMSDVLAGVPYPFFFCMHYWDGDSGPTDPVEFPSFYPAYSFANAYQRAYALWLTALYNYVVGRVGIAYEYLGRVAHLLQDMTVPAHAHEDFHHPGNDDCFERWMEDPELHGNICIEPSVHDTWRPGWTMGGSYEVGGQVYVVFLNHNDPTKTEVHVHRVNEWGNIAADPFVHDTWRSGWTMGGSYEVGGQVYVAFLNHNDPTKTEVHVHRVNEWGNIAADPFVHDTWRPGWLMLGSYQTPKGTYVAFLVSQPLAGTVLHIHSIDPYGNIGDLLFIKQWTSQLSPGGVYEKNGTISFVLLEGSANATTALVYRVASSWSAEDGQQAGGLLVIPSGVCPIWYLMYTANQTADYFASDDEDGDSVVATTPARLPYVDYSSFPSTPTRSSELADNDVGSGSDYDGDLSRIGRKCVVAAIRATATLFKLFQDTLAIPP